VHDAILRGRLFARLEQVRERRPALCVVGPPGAGKTTLVASWLDVARLDGIWYQVDPGDADLATFFYYLRMAAARFAAKGQPALPLLTPEYLPDIDGFARRFFRDLFSRLPSATTLVLDNYQEVQADARFHAVVAQAVDEIPSGITLIAISRRDPPHCYARLIANEHVSFIQWEDLRLSREEAQAISAKRATLSREQFELLYRASDGWAAGLTLMLERLKRNGIEPEAVAAETREAVFNYFAGVIFDRLPAETQHVCLTTALLPQVTARGADLVSGQPQAAQLLEHLYRGRLFTDRRMVVAAGQTSAAGGEGLVATYQYHPLFRAFLLERGRSTWSPDVRERWSLNAASLLELSGQTADAIAILIGLAQWARGGELMVRQAPRLIAQGRWQTLQGWLQALPEPTLEDNPWLVYWWGISLLAVDQGDARKRLERAHTLMQGIGDITGQLVSAAGVIDSICYHWTSFTEMDPWIATIQTLLAPQPSFDSVDTELHVNSSLLIALSYRQPGHPMLPGCAARVTQLLDTDADVNLRVTAGTFLLGYCYFAAEYDLAKHVIAGVEPLLAHADVTPLNRVWWRARVSYHAYHVADYRAALCALDEADAILHSHGLAGLQPAEPMLAYFRLLVALGSRDMAAARERLATLRRLARPERRFRMWYLQSAESILALLDNDPVASLEFARASIRTAADMGMLYVHELSLTLTAHVLAQLGRFDDALDAASEAKALVEGSVIHNMAAEPLFVEAWIAARRGDSIRAIALVRSAFEASRQTRYAFWFRFMPDVLPQACELALSAAVDIPFVTSVVKRYEIPPPRPYARDWPWPLRISTLGQFGVVKAGVAVDESRGGTRKPMELLKAIIALGVDNVSVAALIDHLWPDSDGDAGQRAFDTTLHRMRKQLGDDRAVVLKAGKVGVDSKSCWVDVTAFERLVQESSTVSDRTGATRAAADLRALYRGPFLGSDGAQRWALNPRQRLHARFLATVSKLGAVLEDCGEGHAAEALYRHAIDIDACAEPIYRCLMRCYRRAGRVADAVEIYRLCCGSLEAAGIARPSAETEMLYRDLASPNPA
jgi:pentatricopeptide repeat protein